MEARAVIQRKRQNRKYWIVVGFAIWLMLVCLFMIKVYNVPLGVDPFSAVMNLINQWNTSFTILFIFICVASIFTVIGISRLIYVKNFRTKTRVDFAEKYFLSRSSGDWKNLTKERTQELSKRYNIKYPGFFLGKEIRRRKNIYCSIENSLLMLAGPGAGKTSGFVIPFIVNCPGPVISTSNKDDVYKETHKLRESLGEVYLFDMMGITGLPQTMWYDPLAMVVDEARASTLANHFYMAAGDVKSKDFWNVEGITLLSLYFLACHYLKLPITQVYTWVTEKNTTDARLILEKKGFKGGAETLDSYAKLFDETKSGIFATCRYLASPLTNRNYQKWIVPPEDESIQKFDPMFFVQGCNTVYALSSEKGESNASALVTAICNDLVEVAENYAKTSPGSHLPYPMLVALDEAANICRWEKLPDLYSYYRAYGITLLTVLQSYSQGTEVWKENGMKKIWSAANIILFLGGISEPDFLQNVSNLCGQYEYTSTSVSYDSLWSIAKGSQASDQKTNVLEVSDLQVWPQGKNFIKLWRNKIFNLSTSGKVYQPRRTLLLSSDAILILETKPYFESFSPQLLEIIAKGNKAYEERRANAR